MKARWLAVAAVVMLAAIGVWLGRGAAPRAVPQAGASGGLASGEPGEPGESTTALEPARVPRAAAERLALAPGATRAPAGDEDEEVEPDPPTPEHPGPGQALLSVAVVARETGAPLAGVRLQMSSTEEDEEHEWRSSTQPDPSRGAENDDVLTDANGRGEFVLQADFAYTLTGEGENGLGEEGELALEPFRAGEMREGKLALRTAWDFDWYGQVIDGETELPIAGAEVAALATYSAETLEELHVLARATTAPGGRVVLRLPAWEHASACARTPGYFRAGCEVKAAQGSFDSVGVIQLFRAGSLEVFVTGDDGLAAAGVEVRVHTAAWQLAHEVGLPGDIEWRARSDGDGRCAFEELPARVEFSLDFQRGAGVLQRLDRLQLDPGERRRLEWRLPSGCGLTGVVRDPEGRPLAGVPLLLTQVEGPLWVHHLRDGDFLAHESGEVGQVAFASLRSDARGRFALDDVTPGTWGLGTPEDTRDLPAVQLVFEIAPGQLAREIELELPRALSIHGVVLDPEGNPARLARVSCQGKDAPRRRFEKSDWSARDGSFVLGPLLAGDYWVSAWPDDPMHGVSERIEASAGDRDVVVRLRWAGVLGGSVVDAETGELAAAVVTGPDGTMPMPSEAFEFEHLLPGSYDLVARTEDGRIGVLAAVPSRERERKEELVIPVRRGVALHSRTRAAEGVFFRVGVEWEGLGLGGEWGDLESFTVPPGHVVVRWYRIEKETGEVLEHEESRTVALGQEPTLEWELR